MLIDDEAVVLDARPFRDRHQIASFRTRGHGTVRAVVRKARTGKHPLAAATQVLSHVRLVAFQRPAAELATCRQLDLIRSSWPLAQDLERSTAAAVVAELLDAFTPAGDSDDRPFRLGRATLEALLDGLGADAAVGYAEAWTLRLAGLLAETDEEWPADTRPPATAGRFLAQCRRLGPAELDGPPDASTRQWLDGRVRAEAERGLPALRFLRGLEPADQ